ncbi:MAG: DUF559 domain-containing protein [Micropruina sp.]|nr:DUF559 domain-containing protein [Micropruina sp.]
MLQRQYLPALAISLAAVQGGVISADQCYQVGVTPRVVTRMLRDGTLGAVTRGIYSVGGPVGWLGRAWAGLLLGGAQACLGYEAAGYLQGLVAHAPEQIRIFVPSSVTPVARSPWVFVRSPRRSVGEPSRTAVPDTLLDLCSEATEDGVARYLADALHDRRTSAQQVLAALAARGRFPHRRLIMDVLGDVVAGVGSALERRYLRDVERAHGLPTALRQARPIGTYAADTLYGPYRVIVELDGRGFHGGSRALRDQLRDLEHASVGLITLRVGWSDVAANPCLVARAVAQALMANGWEGPLTPCEKCRQLPL